MVYSNTYVLLFYSSCPPLQNSRNKKPYILWTGCAAVRAGIELLLTQKPQIITLNVHVSPLIRVFDFLLGMIIAKIFTRKSARVYPPWIMSIIEIFGLTGIMLLDHFAGVALPKTVFVCLISILVYCFSLNSGIVSKILSSKLFGVFGTIQLEFYLLHAMSGSFVYLILGAFFPILRENTMLNICISLVLLLSMSYVYRKWLKKKSENIAKKFFRL